MEVVGANVTVVGGGMMFGEIVGLVEGSLSPDDVELALADAIADPIKRQGLTRVSKGRVSGKFSGCRDQKKSARKRVCTAKRACGKKGGRGISGDSESRVSSIALGLFPDVEFEVASPKDIPWDSR